MGFARNGPNEMELVGIEEGCFVMLWKYFGQKRSNSDNASSLLSLFACFYNLHACTLSCSSHSIGSVCLSRLAFRYVKVFLLTDYAHRWRYHCLKTRLFYLFIQRIQAKWFTKKKFVWNTSFKLQQNTLEHLFRLQSQLQFTFSLVLFTEKRLAWTSSLEVNLNFALDFPPQSQAFVCAYSTFDDYAIVKWKQK